MDAEVRAARAAALPFGAGPSGVTGLADAIEGVASVGLCESTATSLVTLLSTVSPFSCRVMGGISEPWLSSRVGLDVINRRLNRLRLSCASVSHCEEQSQLCRMKVGSGTPQYTRSG